MGTTSDGLLVSVKEETHTGKEGLGKNHSKKTQGGEGKKWVREMCLRDGREK